MIDKPNNTAEKCLMKYVEALVCNRKTMGPPTLEKQKKVLLDSIKMIDRELENRKGGY